MKAVNCRRLVAIGALAFGLTAAPAAAQTYTGVTPPNVGGIDTGAPGIGPTAVGSTAEQARLAATREAARLAAETQRARALRAAEAQRARTLRTAAAGSRAPVRLLAVTGADLAGLALMGLASVGVGVGLVRRSRRRAHA